MTFLKKDFIETEEPNANLEKLNKHLVKTRYHFYDMHNVSDSIDHAISLSLIENSNMIFDKNSVLQKPLNFKIDIRFQIDLLSINNFYIYNYAKT